MENDKSEGKFVFVTDTAIDLLDSLIAVESSLCQSIWPGIWMELSFKINYLMFIWECMLENVKKIVEYSYQFFSHVGKLFRINSNYVNEGTFTLMSV